MFRVRWAVAVFVSFNCAIWISFAGLWLLFAKCVENVNNFHDALLFSIETYTTIGFGYRNVGSDCPHATVLLMVQSLCASAFNCLLTGLLFTSVARLFRKGKDVRRRDLEAELEEYEHDIHFLLEQLCENK